MPAIFLRLTLLALVVLAAGCSDVADEPMGNGPMGDGMSPGGGDRDPMMDPMEGAGGMGMGEAAVTQLAMTRLGGLPAEILVWMAYELPPEGEANGSHSHGPAFVYAAEGEVRVDFANSTHVLEQGEAVDIPAGFAHTHLDGGWEIVLTSTETPLPEGTALVFRSEPLEGVPEAPLDARFVHVALPPGSMTTVHEHPGTEYVWVSEGMIEHRSERDGTVQMSRGDDHALPPHTAVQKRNTSDGDAAFLSLFLVDPEQPFVIDSSFG